MIMYLDIKNAYKSYPIIETSVRIRKTRDNRDMNNNTLISSDYLKLACDFKSILICDYHSEEK